MTSLRSFLTNKRYIRIKLEETPTGHFRFDLKINGIKGSFILDTGASNTCVGFEALGKFNLFAEDSNVLAAGAGAVGMVTRLSSKNRVDIGKWNAKNVAVVLFDLSHVNKALVDHGIDSVDGILGADVLDLGRAVIDYQYKCLYLKKRTHNMI